MQSRGIPKYHQIKQILLHDIKKGKYLPDEKLPSIRKLSKLHNISDITTRQVVRELVSDGAVYTIPGKGCFVSNAIRTVAATANAGKKKIHQPSGNNRIVFITTDTKSEFYAQILTGILNVTQPKGYVLEVYNSRQKYYYETELLAKCIKEPIEGLIFVPSFENRSYIHLLRLREKGVPVVLLDRRIRDYDFDYVTSNNIKAAKDAVSYLIKQGHKRIACLIERKGVSTIRERIEGYKKALIANKLKTERDLILGNRRDGLKREEKEISMLINKLLSRKIKFTAIFAMNDITAIRVYRVLKRKGIRVPDDVSIVGFNDEPMAQYFEVPLTTVKQDMYHLGYHAAKLLFNRIVEKSDNNSGALDSVDSNTISLKTKLIIRESVKKYVAQRSKN